MSKTNVDNQSIIPVFFNSSNSSLIFGLGANFNQTVYYKAFRQKNVLLTKRKNINQQKP
jgi:hypothetical protein